MKIDINACLCIKQLKYTISCVLAYAMSVIQHESSIFCSSFPLKSNLQLLGNIFYIFISWTNSGFVWNTNSIFPLNYFISSRLIFITLDFSISCCFFLNSWICAIEKFWACKSYAPCIDYSIPCIQRKTIFFFLSNWHSQIKFQSLLFHSIYPPCDYSDHIYQIFHLCIKQKRKELFNA